METKPGFDLEQKLGAWRQALASSPAVPTETVEELESHLRDSIAGLRGKGLTEAEAFLIATRRLGSVESVGDEFGKLNGRHVAAWRAFWMIAGVLAWVGISCLAGILGNAAAWVALQVSVDLGGYALGWVGALASLLVFSGAALLLGRFVLAPAGATFSWRPDLLGRPWRLGLVVAIALMILAAARMAMPAVLVRTAPPQQLAWFFGVYQAAGAAAALALPAVLVAMMALVNRRRARSVLGVLMLLLVGGLGLFGSGCGKPASSSAGGAEASSSGPASAVSTPLEQALALWKQGDKSQAVEEFLKADFSQKRLVSQGNVLGYSEAQFVALPAAARAKLGQELTDGFAPLKALCREVIETGQRAAASGDQAKAEACRAQVQRLGESLSRPDYTTLAQLVGKALVKLGAAP